MKFLHVIPPHAVNAYEVVKFIKRNFPEEEHAILVMQSRNWVISNAPRLLAYLDILYLPEKKSVITKINRLRTTMKWLDDAEHIVLHSVFSIHGKLFLPLFCRTKYAKKCIWMETYTDFLRWRRPGKGRVARFQNRLLEKFLREIPIVGMKLLSDKAAYIKCIKGSARLFLTPQPVFGEYELDLARGLMEANGEDPEQMQYYDYEDLIAECEENFQRSLAEEKLARAEQEVGAEEEIDFDDSYEEDESHEEVAAFSGETPFGGEMLVSEEESFDDAEEEEPNSPVKGKLSILMVEGDMLLSHNHLSLFRSLKPLADEGLIAANMNHIGKHCYTGNVPYRRMMFAAGKRTLGRKYTDFIRPNASKDEFYKYISKVDGILLFGGRTLNPQFIWLMLLMNKKVFLRANTPLYRYLRSNNVPVIPFHYLRNMSMEQFTRPIRTDNCQWVRTFVEEENVADCWREMFDYAQERRNEGKS